MVKWVIIISVFLMPATAAAQGKALVQTLRAVRGSETAAQLTPIGIRGIPTLGAQSCGATACSLANLVGEVDAAAAAAAIEKSASGNRGGVYFVGTTVPRLVVKPEATWPQAVSMALAAELGLRTPASAYSEPVLWMEEIEGWALDAIPEGSAPLLLTDERLHNFGRLAAFDILTRNLDRFPVWYDVTNSGNVLLTRAGHDVIGIDQAIGTGDPTNKGLVDAFGLILSRVGNGELAGRMRKWITKETGHDIGEAGAAQIESGLIEGVHHIATLTNRDIMTVGARVPGGSFAEADAAFFDLVLGHFRARSQALHLRVLRDAQLAARSHNMEFPVGLVVPGFKPKGVLGGGSSIAWLAEDDAHVIKVYRADSGLARYEVWVTRFFEELGIPVPPVVFHGELAGTEKAYYVVVKEYANGFFLRDISKHNIPGLDRAAETNALRALVARVTTIQPGAFEAFLARHGVDPRTEFGPHVSAQFLDQPGDVLHHKLWDNFVRTDEGWVLIDP